jgi:hypothetical protein
VSSLELDHLKELLIRPFFSCRPYDDGISSSAVMLEVSLPRMMEVSPPRMLEESLPRKRGYTPPPPYEDPPSYDVAVQMEIELTKNKRCVRVPTYTNQFYN